MGYGTSGQERTAGQGDAMVSSMSVGSRQTRKERRTRRRAQLRGSASAVLRESARTVLSMVITVAHASARGVRKVAGVVLRDSSRAGRNLLISAAHALTRSAAWASLLFVALLGTSAAVVVSGLVDMMELAVLFCLLTVILCAALLWVQRAS
jgi:hypothetical protein